jgi:hypothetical protein
MKAEHLLWLGAGVVIGWLVVPMVLSMIGQKTA